MLTLIRSNARTRTTVSGTHRIEPVPLTPDSPTGMPRTLSIRRLVSARLALNPLPGAKVSSTLSRSAVMEPPSIGRSQPCSQPGPYSVVLR